MSYRKLVNLSDGKYGPVPLIYGHFVREIIEDEYLGKKILFEFKAKKLSHSMNLNMVFNCPWAAGTTFSAIYVDADSSQDNSHFHKITYASSNLKDILGYRISELLGIDLNRLVPNPVAVYHKKLLNTIQDGGKMFLDQNLLPQMIRAKDGDVKAFQMQLRFQNTIYNTLEVVCSMNFTKDKRNCCVVITDDQGTICELTSAARKYFTEGSSIFLYNPRFERVYKVGDEINF